MYEPVLLLAGLPLRNAAISASTIGKHPGIQRKVRPLFSLQPGVAILIVLLRLSSKHSFTLRTVPTSSPAEYFQMKAGLIKPPSRGLY
jgi:hypothetical protein